MNNKEIRELLVTIRSQYEKVLDHAAFLDLKQSELRPGDEISFTGFWQARQQLDVENSILSGHAFMVQELVQTQHVKLDADSKRLLEQVQAHVQRLFCY